MTLKRCSWGPCKSDSRYKDRPHMQGVTFRMFPNPRTQLARCMHWIQMCNRPHHRLNVNKITRYHFVCSKHFVEGSRDPLPSCYTEGRPYRLKAAKKQAKKFKETTVTVPSNSGMHGNTDEESLSTLRVHFASQDNLHLGDVIENNVDETDPHAAPSSTFDNPHLEHTYIKEEMYDTGQDNAFGEKHDPSVFPSEVRTSFFSPSHSRSLSIDPRKDLGCDTIGSSDSPFHDHYLEHVNIKQEPGDIEYDNLIDGKPDLGVATSDLNPSAQSSSTSQPLRKDLGKNVDFDSTSSSNAKFDNVVLEPKDVKEEPIDEGYDLGLEKSELFAATLDLQLELSARSPSTSRYLNTCNYSRKNLDPDSTCSSCKTFDNPCLDHTGIKEEPKDFGPNNLGGEKSEPVAMSLEVTPGVCSLLRRYLQNKGLVNGLGCGTDPPIETATTFDNLNTDGADFKDEPEGICQDEWKGEKDHLHISPLELESTVQSASRSLSFNNDPIQKLDSDESPVMETIATTNELSMENFVSDTNSHVKSIRTFDNLDLECTNINEELDHVCEEDWEGNSLNRDTLSFQSTPKDISSSSCFPCAVEPSQNFVCRGKTTMASEVLDLPLDINACNEDPIENLTACDPHQRVVISSSTIQTESEDSAQKSSKQNQTIKSLLGSRCDMRNFTLTVFQGQSLAQSQLSIEVPTKRLAGESSVNSSCNVPNFDMLLGDVGADLNTFHTKSEPSGPTSCDTFGREVVKKIAVPLPELHGLKASSTQQVLVTEKGKDAKMGCNDGTLDTKMGCNDGTLDTKMDRDVASLDTKMDCDVASLDTIDIKMDCKNDTLLPTASETSDKKSDENQTLFTCHICKENFKTHFELAEHLLIKKHSEEELSSYYKTLLFSEKETKDTVPREADTDFLKKHKCRVCDKAFSKREYLLNHERLHLGERPYGCIMCHKAFVHKSSLVEHMKTHHGKKPRQVKRSLRLNPKECGFCGELFQTLRELRYHVTSHLAYKPYQCDICGYTSRRRSNLTTHKKSHSSVKQFLCEICGKEYKAAKDLKKHMLLHEKKTSRVNKAIEELLY